MSLSTRFEKAVALADLTAPLFSREYEDLKYKYNRLVEEDFDGKGEHLSWDDCLALGGVAAGDGDLYYARPHSLREVIAFHKRTTQGLAKWNTPQAKVYRENFRGLMANGRGSDTVDASDAGIRIALDRAHTLAELWLPLAEAFVRAKDQVVKGRRPSATPRKTDARTLENTGTCAVCFKNVKIPGGAMYDHGFTLRWGGRNGHCLGVGYPPWEVSPKGREMYWAALQRERPLVQGQIQKLQALPAGTMLDHGTDAWGKARRRPVAWAIADAESELRTIDDIIKETEKMLATWAPAPLPVAGRGSNPTPLEYPEDRRPNPDLCPSHGCRRKAWLTCGGCGRLVCEHHGRGHQYVRGLAMTTCLRCQRGPGWKPETSPWSPR